MRRCMRSREQQQQQQPLAVQQEPPVDASYLRQTAAAALSFAELSGLSCPLNSSSSSRTKGGHYCSSKQRESSSTRRGPESSCSTWNGCGKSRNTGGDGRGKDEDSSNRLNSGNSSSDFFRCFFASPADTCSKTGFPCLFSDTGNGNTGCCPPSAVGVRKLRCVSAPEKTGLSLHSETKQRQLYLQRGFSEHHGQQEQSLQQQRLQQPVEQQQQQHLEQQLQQRVQQHEQHQQRVQQHEHQEQQQQRQDDFMRQEGREPPNCEGDLKACAGETEVASWDRRQLSSSSSNSSSSNSSSSNSSSSSSTETDEGATRRRKVVMRESATRDEDGRRSFSEGRGQKAEGTSSSQIGKESVERSSNAEEKKLLASTERELERTRKEVKETVAQETNQAGTTETQTLSRSVLSALSFSQLLIKPCVRSATVYGLRQLLLQLLQLQRQTYISSCLDPTQRITHLLSQGRLKAERHSVRTADGYQIFFYRLCQVKAHCCCSWCTHSHHPRCTYSAAFSVGCPYTPSPQQQYCTGNSSSSVSSKNRKECRASRASSVGDGQNSSGSHRNPSNSNSSSKDDDSSFQVGRRTCTARRDGDASSSSTAAVADAATEVGVTEKSHPTCAAVLSSKWEMPLPSCADQQEKVGGFPSRSSRCSSFQKSQQKGCCCCCSILGKARGEATTAASNRSRNAICVSQPVIRSEATAYPPPSPGDTAACSRWSSTDTRGSSSDSRDSSCCRSRRRRSSRRRRRNRNSSNRSSSNRGSKDRESDAARSNIYTKNSSSRNSSTCSRSRSRGKSSKRKKRDTCMAPCKGEAARCSWRSEEERTRRDTPAAAAAASRCLQQHQQQNQIEEESSRHCGFKERGVSLRVKEESSACAMHAAAQLHLPMERPFIAATWEGMWMKGEAAGEEDTAATNGVGSDNAAAAAAAKVEGNDSNAAVVVARAAAAAAQAAVLGNNTRSATAVEVMGIDIISAATPAVQGPCSAGSSTKASTRSGEGRLNDQEAATEADTAAEEAVNEEKGTVKEETLGWWREKIKEAGMSSIEMGGRSRNSVNKHPVVYMQHGLLESSLNWVSGGDGSLAFALAYEGCDVWLGNNRGNEYTRLLPLDRSRRPRRNRCMHSTPHGCSCCCCLGSPAAASYKINSAAVNGTDRVCGTRNSGTNTAATGSKSAIGGRTAAAAGGRRSITTARVNRSPTVIEEEAVEWPAGFSAAASHRICRSRDRTSKEVSVTVGEPSDAPVKNTTTWMRCLKGWKGGREVYQGLSGHEIENYLHTEIDALRKKSQRSRQLGGGVYRHSPQELQQINAEKKHREQRRNKEDAATEIAQARTEEEEKAAAAAAAAAAAPATAATIAATDNSPQQQKDVHLRQARWRRRTRRIMRGALCCSALCCHCTGLTPLPEFEKGVSMQMQRQQLRQACVDAFAVLLLLLGPGNSRRSLQKRREKEAHHRLLQQGEHQQAGAHEKNKMKQQQQPQRLIQNEGFNNIYDTSSGSEPQQQSNEQEGRWLISRERQRSNISLSGNVRAQQQQRQRDIDPCATSWGDVTEENRLSGVYWRRDRRRSYQPCSRLTKEERQRTDTFIIVNALDAASGEVGTHRRNSSCEDASVAGVGQDQQQEIHESRWEKEGKQQVAEVPEPTEKDLEAPVDIENLSSCSSSEDDEVPPFRSALRSATGQQWTYRDMAAYDVPAMLDYILSFRQETSTAAATAIRNRCGMDRAPTSRCRQTACACRGAHIASDTAVQQDFNEESLYSATPASSWGQHLLSTGREEIHKDALESIVATEQQRERLVLQEPQKPQQVQQQEQQEEQLQKQQHNHLHSESCTVPAYQQVLLREGEGPPQKQCAEGVDEKRLYVSCPERQEEVESSSKQQAHKTEREEENKGDSFLGSIWAVGQSQGAAQLLAMLALYPALGLLFRGVVLFSPPVVLQAPGTLSTSARMFINLALQMPEKVLLSIRAAEQLLPVPVLSLLGDFVAGKRLMGFYTGSIGWQQRCINFRYTPSGGTSKRNFDLWVGSMARASCSNIKNSRRSSRSASSHNSQRRASVTRKERAALASSRDAPAGAASVASDAADESLTPATAITSRLGDGHDRKGSSETDAESEIGKGSAASYPLERICCPIFALLGGKDNLVDADASSNHLLHYLKRTQLLHVEIWKESGHLDFGWAQARRVDLYPRLLRLLLSPKYSQELQKHCLQLLLQQQ